MTTERKEITPLEIKAEGIALLALGYSTRQVERRLRDKFPGARTPRYNTIARWLNSAEAVQKGKRSADLRWQLVLWEAARIVEQRMDELRHLPFMTLIKSYGRFEDIAHQARVRRERLRSRSEPVGR